MYHERQDKVHDTNTDESHVKYYQEIQRPVLHKRCNGYGPVRKSGDLQQWKTRCVYVPPVLHKLRVIWNIFFLLKHPESQGVNDDYREDEDKNLQEKASPNENTHGGTKRRDNVVQAAQEAETQKANEANDSEKPYIVSNSFLTFG